MKTKQSVMLFTAVLAASNVLAQEPQAVAPQQTLTFPPQQHAGNQVQYPGVGQQALQFPSQSYVQQQPMAYPYGNYAYPGYSSYGYYPYAQTYNPYAQAYNPYASMYRAYPQTYNTYNPYMTQRMMPPPYALRPPVPKEKETKPWGDTRYIWPDFYTDFTGDAWDKMINAPFDMGRMPGGWRFPSISTPDPVTVSDAIANQVPPFAEEAGNMVPMEDVGNMRPF